MGASAEVGAGVGVQIKARITGLTRLTHPGLSEQRPRALVTGATRGIGRQTALALAGAGAADMVSSVFRTSMLQLAAPDAMRGRLQGVFIVVVTGGPRLGDLRAGGVSALSSPTFSLVSGGVACVLGAVLLALAVPAFARYRARGPNPELGAVA